jgi:myosin heavy subunit
MQVTQIVYTKTVQEKEYEPEMMEMTATLEDGENAVEAANALRNSVRSILGLAGAAKTTAKKTTTRKKKVEEPTDEPPEVPEEAEAEEKPARKRAAKTSKTAKKATASKGRKKPVQYNREVKEHKLKLAELLTEHFPDWKKDDNLKKAAKEASANMEGVDFLDGNDGSVLDTFVSDLLAEMEAESSGSGDEL